MPETIAVVVAFASAYPTAVIVAEVALSPALPIKSA